MWKVRRETIRVPHSGMGQFPDEVTTGEGGGLWETTIAVNLGGAILPLVLSVYLLDRASLVMSGDMVYLKVLAGILLVAAIAYVTTRPMVGVGIRAPLFIPGLTALLCGVLLARGIRAFRRGYCVCQRNGRHAAGRKHRAPLPRGRSRSAEIQHRRCGNVWRDLYRVPPVRTDCVGYGRSKRLFVSRWSRSLGACSRSGTLFPSLSVQEWLVECRNRNGMREFNCPFKNDLPRSILKSIDPILATYFFRSRGDHFPRSSTRDPNFFRDLQQLSDRFSGIFISRSALFRKCFAPGSLFFLQTCGSLLSSVGKCDDY